MFGKRQLRVVESLRERTASGTVTLRSAPLASNNPIEFIWPRDADRHVAALAKGGCEQHRFVDVMIDDEMFAQIKWGSISFGDEDGVDIARTIQHCRGMGVPVVVVGMPSVYEDVISRTHARTSSARERKRKRDDALPRPSSPTSPV